MSKTRPTIICYTTLEIKDMAKAVAKVRRRPVSKLVEDLVVDAYTQLKADAEARPSLI